MVDAYGSCSAAQRSRKHVRRVRAARAAADDRDRLLRGTQELEGRFEVLVARPIDACGRRLRREEVDARTACFEDVVRNVDEDGSRPGTACDAEGGAQRALEIVDIADADASLRDGAHDGGDVGFLKAVGAHQRRADLTRDRDERDRIHLRVEDARDEVRRARARGREADADASRRARVAARGEGGGRFMPGEDVLEVVRVERIVERHDRAARIPEDDFDALIGEDVEHELCAGIRGRFGHRGLPSQEKSLSPVGGRLCVSFLRVATSARPAVGE